MTHPDGGFYSAEDADSEGQEGKFYCWTKDELSKLLTPEEFNVAAKYFGITTEGNFVDHSHPQPLAGLNVLSIVNPNVPVADQPLLAVRQRKNAAARAKRVRPHLDDKILASWNGLMLGAFARASVILNDEKYRAAAEKNLAVHPGETCGTKNPKRFSTAGATASATTCNCSKPTPFCLSGVIDLYEATLEPKHLDFAIELAEAMLAKFYDPENGGFWQSAADTQRFDPAREGRLRRRGAERAIPSPRSPC